MENEQKNAKCEYSGCKCAPAWRAHKLWGKGGSILLCAKHKPDPSKRPESLKNLPVYYRYERLGA